jgi:poly [ADP-ribose] polymerase
MKYMIEFSLPTDTLKTKATSGGFVGAVKPHIMEMINNNNNNGGGGNSDIRGINESKKNDEKEVGLVGSGGGLVPLRGVQIQAHVLDQIGEVTVLQVYMNESLDAIEAKYIFPLDEMASVCGFEAYINGKHIIYKSIHNLSITTK